MMDDRLTPGGEGREVRRPADSTLRTPDVSGQSTEADAAFELTNRPVTEVQQWLDGEGTEADARRADPRETAMWAKIADETERRGRMVTPAPVLDRLMAAIPAEPAQDNGVLGKVKKLFGK